ncbi:MAG: sensor histidine kinase [Sphingomonadaceae bacterium]
MPDKLSFLASGSPMVCRVKQFDWSRTPLGVPSGWPPELVSAAATMLESRFPSALVWGPELTTLYNDAFLPILGDKGDVLGQPFSQIWQEVWDDIGPIAERAYAGEATFIEDFPLTVMRSRYPEKAWFTFCYSPVRTADGRVAGMLDTVVETTQTVLARQHSDVLNKELVHRLKNTMSLVQSIAMQSLKTVDDRQTVDLFLRRILALGKAHDVLLQQNWENGTIRHVIEQVLTLHGGLGRFQVSGEDVVLDSRAVLSLSLILHELATNAAKYGALSTAGGTVDIGWRIEPREHGEVLCLWWRERDGPPVSPPSRKGFGSRLIAMGLSGAGSVETHYHPDGFEADFCAPLKVIQASGDPAND